MKHVTLFCEGLHNRAGIERMTVELANLLVKSYAVDIVVINQFSFDTCPYTVDKGVKVVSLNAEFKKSLLNFNLGVIKDLRRHVIKNHTDVIITVATPLVRITAPAACGLNIKNIGWEHFNINAGTKYGRMFKILASKWVDCTVSLTDADTKDYLTHGGKRVLTIPNFTSIGDNLPSKCENKILLAVGRHAPQKGFDTLIKAWAKTDAPVWMLRIVGSGDDKDKNMQLAKSLNLMSRIEFQDSTPNIAKEFQEASCFVLSSRFEGLVLVLIEAKMMGLPSICFDCPNSPREVIRDGVDGWLVPPENIDALAKELTLRLSNIDMLKTAGGLAREDAMKRYSPIAIKQMWIELIEKR